jgi:xanthine dehydrogenase accessory factor
VRDLLPRLLGWWRAGERAAVATVVRTVGSAPRGPGAAMAVGPGDEVIGSVSGGCVESAVYGLCLEVARTGRPVPATYGISSDTAFEEGLSCGGTIEVFVAPLSRTAWPGFGSFAERVLGTGPAVPGGGRGASGVCLATVVAAPDGGAPVGRRVVVPGAGSDGADAADAAEPDGLVAAVTADAAGQLAAGVSALREYGPHGERTGTVTR